MQKIVKKIEKMWKNYPYKKWSKNYGKICGNIFQKIVKKLEKMWKITHTIKNCGKIYTKNTKKLSKMVQKLGKCISKFFANICAKNCEKYWKKCGNYPHHIFSTLCTDLVTRARAHIGPFYRHHS